MNTKYKVIIGVVLVGFIILARLIPHLPNVAPVAAVGLVAARYLGKRFAILLPVLGMFVSDMFIGFYHLPVMLSVYGSFMLIGFGAHVLMKYWRVPVVSYSIGASMFFFLITNFAVWLSAAWYPKTLSGLLLAYEMGVPFLRYALVGDFLYTAVLSGVFALAHYGLRKQVMQKAQLANMRNFLYN
jgi:hypothetical protein